MIDHNGRTLRCRVQDVRQFLSLVFMVNDGPLDNSGSSGSHIATFINNLKPNKCLTFGYVVGRNGIQRSVLSQASRSNPQMHAALAFWATNALQMTATVSSRYFDHRHPAVGHGP